MMDHETIQSVSIICAAGASIYNAAAIVLLARARRQDLLKREVPVGGVQFTAQRKAQVKRLAAGYEAPGKLTFNDIEIRERGNGSPGGLTVGRMTIDRTDDPRDD